MSILTYNQITKKKVLVLEGELYEVLDSRVFSKQQRKPVNQTKLRNLVTGKVTEQTFQASDKAEEAELHKKVIKYLYHNKGEWWFSEPDDPSNRFPLGA